MPYFHKGTLRQHTYATFNARVENIASAPAFRDAFKKRRRCIIPIYGFYEWTGDKKDRQPHYFTAADGAPVMALAGLWERWNDPETLQEMLSATIIVGAASQWMRKYHDRMPMMLDPKDFDRWLDGTAGLEVLKPAPEDALREWSVSKRVNKSGEGDDDPTVKEPIHQSLQCHADVYGAGLHLGEQRKKRTLTGLEGASRFVNGGWPSERDRPTYVAALKACLAALEGVGTADQARESIVEAASAAGMLAG